MLLQLTQMLIGLDVLTPGVLLQVTVFSLAILWSRGRQSDKLQFLVLVLR